MTILKRLRMAWAGLLGAAPTGGGGPLVGAASGSGLAIAHGAALSRTTLGAALGVGGLAILGFAAQGGRTEFLRIASLGFLLAGAGLGAGALLGFIFGVPRTQERVPEQRTAGGLGEDGGAGARASYGAPGIEYRGNTNLEQISDWLTKILVGVSLTQYREIVGAVRRLVDFLTPAFALANDSASARSLVLTLLVFAPVCGFLLSYILTRIYFAVALRKADVELSLAAFRPSIDLQVSELRRAIPIRESSAGREPVSGWPFDQVRVLAQEFENLRAALPPSEERTRRCESVAAQMRSLALAPGAQEVAARLMYSDSPGERLAAIAILQVMPQRRALRWLADRVASDQPFIGYHAALALVYAVRALEEDKDLDKGDYRLDLQDAVRTARLSLGGDLAGTDRALLVGEAERLLR